MKTNRFGKRWKAIAVLLVFAVLLVSAGCGRKAPPEPPESGSLSPMQYAIYRDGCGPESIGAGAPALKINALYSAIVSNS